MTNTTFEIRSQEEKSERNVPNFSFVLNFSYYYILIELFNSFPLEISESLQAGTRDHIQHVLGCLGLVMILKYLSFDALRIESTFTLAVQWLGLGAFKLWLFRFSPLVRGNLKIKKNWKHIWMTDCYSSIWKRCCLSTPLNIAAFFY